MSKLAACVVLYYPDENTFGNILSYAYDVDSIIIVDNTEESNQDLINPLKELLLDKLIYINNGSNLGIATALNIACKKAKEMHFEWILTMDQDSSFDNFKYYKECFIKVKDIPKLALLAANTNEEKGNSFMTYQYLEDKITVITLANILNLSYYTELGGFEDKLFIDMVDYDYCFKVKINKLKILYFNDVFVNHKIGEIYLRKHFLTGKVKYKAGHNFQRVYYIARNSLYIAKKYGNEFPKEISLKKVIKNLYIKDIKRTIAYDPDKLKRIKAKLLALYHFLVNKYGRYDI